MKENGLVTEEKLDELIEIEQWVDNNAYL
jgi:hypothetical protein